MDQETTIVVESTLVEEIPNTPVVAEVVDTPAPSVIEPVETSNVKVSEVRMWMSRLSHGDDDKETFLGLYEKLNFVCQTDYTISVYTNYVP
ncbi:hypothetical protein F444_22820 [Phytophthora nicotianae P1976]|nr:hypothetical protein F444_22820 [Phytophthora nicotianae P1976]